MDFIRYHDSRQPWESFEQYEYRLKEFRRVQEEEQLRKLRRDMNIFPSMSGMTGIGGRNESSQEFYDRIERERIETKLQRTKKLILLLWVYTKIY